MYNMTMIELLSLMGIPLIGFLIGMLLMWVVMLRRSKREYSRGKEEINIQVATLTERLQARDQESGQLRSELEHAKQRIDRLSEELTQEQQQRSAAVENNKAIPKLENQIKEKQQEFDSLQKDYTSLRERISELETTLEKERKAAEEKLALIEEAQNQLSDAFKALSSEALKSNNESFLDLAKTTLEKFHHAAKGDLDQRQQSIGELVKPMKESLDKVNVRIQDLEKARVGAYASLSEQVKSLAKTQTQLQSDTANLVRALRAPATRGCWGEIQLRRVVEMAGMVEYCDFIEQQSISTEKGRLRPDMVVKLPNKKQIVIDSKTPLEAYLDSLETEDEQDKLDKLKIHAKQIRSHVTNLASKSYWEQFQPTPEFVVMFLPGETFFGAALEQDPSLIEFGVDKKVIIATPITLIAILRAVAYGWHQEKVTENAVMISNLGKELYDRIRKLAEHFTSMQKGLNQTIEAYNKAAGTLESRVLVSTRRFKELGAASSHEIAEPIAVEKAPRRLQASELIVE